MPGLLHPPFNHKPLPPQPIDVGFCLGWTVDICMMQRGVESIIRRDCSLPMLVRASGLFERLALERCTVPLAYGEETRIKYFLPSNIASAAFLRILDWIRAIVEISAHGEIEDPQITTVDEDNLMIYLRLFQAANMMELKYPYHNQKRLPDIIKAHIKKAFDTKNNAFRDITITDRDLGLIWDVSNADRNDSMIKLMLALLVDAYDIRKDFPKKFKDNFVQRVDALKAKNDRFRSAVIDVKTKKDVRLREEERERKGLPKNNNMPQRRNNSNRKNGKRASASNNPGDAESWRDRELTEQQAAALMRRPEEFPIAFDDRAGAKYAKQYYGQGA